MEPTIKIPKYTYNEVAKEANGVHGIYRCPHCSCNQFEFEINPYNVITRIS